MAALGGITVLTGFYLYWRLTGGFDPALSATHGAMVFGTGGIAGLDLRDHRRRRRRTEDEADGRARREGDGAARGARARPLDRASRTPRGMRGVAGARIVLVLQMIAVICMASGHYV